MIDPSAETLLAIIEEHVAEGSIIYTDCWKAYDAIPKVLGMDHMTVNHSKHFKDPVKDPETGVDTNIIEGMWNGIKLQLSPRNYSKDQVEGCIDEVLWRRQHKDNLWKAFMDLLKNTRLDEEAMKKQ